MRMCMRTGLSLIKGQFAAKCRGMLAELGRQLLAARERVLDRLFALVRLPLLRLERLGVHILPAFT